ncbi:MAG: erythromycin esterase family protein [Flavobacteriales bacterium]
MDRSSLVWAFIAVAVVGQAQRTAPVLIGLGEEAHGWASLNARKAHLLDSLVATTGVGRVIMESSFVGAVAARYGEPAMHERLARFAYPYWITDTIVQALERGEARAGGTDLVRGCDIQEDCRFHANTLALLNNEKLGRWSAEMLASDLVLERYIGSEPVSEPMSEAESHVLAGRYTCILSSMVNGARLTDEDSLVARCLENRIGLCRYLTLKKQSERMAFRDSMMYANIRWIVEHERGDVSTVYWAADLHVVSTTSANDEPRWTGDYLMRWLGHGYRAVSITHRKRRTKGADETEYVPKRIPITDTAWRTPCP